MDWILEAQLRDPEHSKQRFKITEQKFETESSTDSASKLTQYAITSLEMNTLVNFQMRVHPTKPHKSTYMKYVNIMTKHDMQNFVNEQNNSGQ